MLTLRRGVTSSGVVLTIALTACRDGGEPPRMASSVEPIVIRAATLTQIGTVDPRYQSYNVEMLPAAER